jgi:drug/metabolite transporter (DMT)-like permease
MTLKQVAVMLVLAALWGGSYLLIRIAVPAFGPMSLMAVRVGIAALVLWVGLRFTGRRSVELRDNAVPLLVVGAVNGAIPFGLIAAAEVHLTASLAAVLGATVPLFSVLIGAVWLRQRVSAQRALGLAMGIVGVAVLVGWSPMALTTETVLGVAALLLAAASYAFSGLFTRAKLAHVPSTTIALGQQLGATTLLVVPALLNPPRLPLPANALWAVLALAVLCTSLAFLLYFYLLAEIGALRTQTVTYLIPVFGMAWGSLFLHEPITRGMLVGLGVILTSVLLVNSAPRAVTASVATTSVT